MNTYKILFALRILKNILTSFIDSFLVLYFFTISDNNILPLGIYKLAAVTAIYAAIFLTRNFAKSRYRILLLRIGILLDLLYFCTIIFLKDRIVDYICLAGILYGLEEGIYYSVYNMIESDEITNEERAGFTGSFTAVQAVLAIIFPLIFGSLMYASGFIKSLAVVVVIVLIRIGLSLYLKPKHIPKAKKTNMKDYFRLTKGDFIFTQLYRTEFLYGIIYAEGAFAYIVTIYIIKVFSDSFSLGIFTSVFSLITCAIGILFARFMDKRHYESVIKVSMVMTTASLGLMVYDCRAVTIIIFNLFYTISKSIVILINENIQANLSNDGRIEKEYKVEYWLANETCFFAARIISNGIFILMAFWNINVIMAVFAACLLLLSRELSKLHRIMK